MASDVKDKNAMRIDKWLWCARLFKTRGLASEAVKKGRVQVNNKRVKPALLVRPDDQICIRSGPYTRKITVLLLATGRKGAAEAAQMYREDPSSIEQRSIIATQIKLNNNMRRRTNRGRPTKRERRQMVVYKKGSD
jgi:ribosome-associated heat shock protein Hsp15